MTDHPSWQDAFETGECRPDGTDRESVTTELHHRHLPQLDEAGFIEWSLKRGGFPGGSTPRRSNRSSN